MSSNATVLLNRLLAKGRFRHLQIMVRLAEFGSVRRTAQAIGMTQPAVTQLLADLEAMLEVELYHRHSRGVMPTAACQVLLPLARQSLSGLHSSAEAIADRADVGRGVVRVWASTAGINGLLVRAIPAFNRQYPDIQVQVREAEMQDQFLGISRHEVDLCICRQTPLVPEGWQFEPLIDDRFVVVCSPKHRLAGKRRIGWRELARETWLLSPTDSAARVRLDALFAKHRISPARCQVITRVSALTWAMLEDQQLLTLVPASVFRQLEEAGQLVSLKLAQPIDFEPMGMVRPIREPAPATQRLVEFLHSFCRR